MTRKAIILSTDVLESCTALVDRVKEKIGQKSFEALFQKLNGLKLYKLHKKF